ncbi:hypothetical protein GQ473_06845 [archaeon]|nr:hypothetical protein [archaeon]
MFERYSRQIATGKITINDQKILAKKRIAVIGVGAIGSLLCGLLVRAGVKNITLIDRDFVEISNLARQSYFEKDVGMAKADALKKQLVDIDSSAKITSIVADIDKDMIGILKSFDLILDGTDNMETRCLINDFCMKNNIPWIYSAAIGTTYTTMNIIPKKTACFECIFEKEIMPGTLDTCETAGILNSTNTQLAAHVVVEAIKILTGKTPSLGLYYFDVWNHERTYANVKMRSYCNACNGKYLHFEGKKTDVVALCGNDSYQIKPAKLVKLDLSVFFKKLKKTMDVELRGNVLHVVDGDVKIALFADGRAIVKNVKTVGQSKAVYSKIVSV